jgi:hypothetical protein
MKSRSGAASPKAQISVIISIGDDERFVRDCVSGLLSQEIELPIEVIAVRQCGSTEAAALLKDLIDDKFPLTFIEGTDNWDFNLDVRASNTGLWLFDGLQIAKGDYVAPLRASDWWSSPYLLSDQVEALESSRVSIACAAPCVEHDVAGYAFHRRSLVQYAEGAMISANEIINDYCLGNLSGVLFRKSALSTLSRDIFRLAFFERCVASAACRGGIVTYLADEGVVERVNIDSHNGAIKLAEDHAKITALSNTAALFSTLTDFDLLTEGQLRTSIRKVQAALLSELVSNNELG